MTTIQCEPFSYRRAWIRTDAVFGCPRPAREAANAAASVDWQTKLNDSEAPVGFRSADALVTLTMPALPSMRHRHDVCGEAPKSQTDWMSL